MAEDEDLYLHIENMTVENTTLQKLKELYKFLTTSVKKLKIKQIEKIKSTLMTIATTVESTGNSAERTWSLRSLIIIYKSRKNKDEEARRTANQIKMNLDLDEKPSVNVNREIFILLGVLCRIYKIEDYYVKEYFKCLVGYLIEQAGHFDNLRKKGTAIIPDVLPRRVSQIAIEGMFDGLSSILCTDVMNTEEENKKKLYNSLKCFLNVDLSSLKLRGVQRGGLRLLTEHIAKFDVEVLRDYKFWHETLLSWAADKEAGTHRAAYHATSAFYSLIANILKTTNEPETRLVFEYFSTYFKETVLETSGRKTPFEVSLAIQGYGQFSYCKYFLDPKCCCEMFTNILSKAEEFLKSATEHEKTLMFLPKYVLALGMIAANIVSIGPQQQRSLQCLFVFLFERFPTMPVYLHHSCIEALLKLLQTLSLKGMLFEDFLGKVVYQTMIRTCSHPVCMDAELLKEKMSPFASYMLLTYDRYLPMWEALLNISGSTQYSDISEHQMQFIARKVYDTFIQSVFTLLEKLQLQTQERSTPQQETNLEEETQQSVSLLEVIGMDPQTSLEACRPKDFRVLLNLVELCQDLLPRVNEESFSRWTVPFIEKLVVMSSKHPLVSGFYKLLTICCKRCNELKFFETENVPSREERQQCGELLQKYLREVLTEVGQYKDDLQVACLGFIMAAPLSMVKGLLPYTVPAFQAVFSVGCSYLPLASSGVSTLQLWNSNLSLDILNPLLLAIVPSLDKFLRTTDLSDNSDSPKELLALQSRPNSRQRMKRQQKEALAVERDTELSALQRNILMLLMQLELNTCQAVANIEDAELAQEAVSWTSRPSLHLELPFVDMKPDLFLDNLLPRVTHLALNCSDRYTRINACEFLHACVLIMLGQAHGMNEHEELRELNKIFARVAPTLLALGCDNDLLVKQLFQPLMLQLTHYYSSKQKFKSEETSVLVDTIMDGITHEYDMALRDFSAVCLKEHVVWSQKQLSSTDTLSSLEKIILQICSFSQHPSPFKRLGAALCINSLYTELRENMTVVDIYWLYLMYHMVNSLKLGATGESEIGIEQQTHKAITHIKRVLTECSYKFVKDSKNRKKPSEFTGICLKHAVAWLLSLCSSPVPACRLASMELVSSLLQKITGANSAAAGLELCVGMPGERSLLQVCEGNQQILTLSPQEITDEKLPAWLEQFHASLSCYLWLLENNLATIEKIITKNSKPQIFFSISNFASICKNKTSSVSSPREIEAIESLKCSSLNKTLDFIYLIIENNSSELQKYLQIILCQEYWQLLGEMILVPSNVGFTLKTHKLTSQLEEKLLRCLTLMKEKLPAQKLSELQNSLQMLLNEHSRTLGTLSSLNQVVKNGASMKMIRYVEGCIVLHKTGLMPGFNKHLLLQEKSGVMIMKKVFVSLKETNEEDEEVKVPKSAGSDEYLTALMKLAFYVGIETRELLSLIRSTEPIKDEETELLLSHGEVFFHRLKTPIVDFLLHSPVASAEDVLGSSIDLRSQLDLCLTLLSSVHNNAELRQSYGVELSACVMNNWQNMASREEGREMEVIELFAYIASMSAKDARYLGTMTWWLCNKLRDDKLSLSLLTRSLDIVPALLTWDTEHHDELRIALETLRETRLLPKSSEYENGTSKLTEYKIFFLRVLSLLQLTQSSMLLNFVATVATTEEQHICHANIVSTLHNVMTSLPQEKQLAAVEEMFEKYRDPTKESTSRISVITQFVIPMLEATSVDTVEQFFLRHMPGLVSVLFEPLVKSETPLEFSNNLSSLIGGWKLIELLCSLVPSENLGPNSAIGIQYDPEKNLCTDLLKNGFNVFQESIKTTNPLYLKYQCMVYNALISIICCLYSNDNNFESKHLKSFFNEQIWLKIIDISYSMNLNMEFSEAPERAKKLVCIRKARREDVGSGTSSQSVQYLSSHELMDSSLHEEVMQFDMSHVDVRSYEQPVQEETTLPEHVEIELELDELNKHPCMATMCGLLRLLVSKVTTSTKPMSWMLEIKKILTNTKAHINIKLFILKLIMNVQDVFKRNATFWLRMLCDEIGRGSFGDTMNYIITDAVSMLLSWKDVIKTESVEYVISCLLTFLVKNAYHKRHAVRHLNLELIKSVVEVWKANINITYYVQTFTNPPSTEVLTVLLQVSSILISNGVKPWNDATKTEIINCLIQTHFKNTNDTGISILSADVIGRIFKLLLQENVNFDNEEKEVKRALTFMCPVSKLNIAPLYAIQKHYPPVIIPYIYKLITDVKHMTGKQKTQSLEMICSGFQFVEDDRYHYAEYYLSLSTLLTAEASEHQELALEICKQLIPVMTCGETLKYVELLTQVLATAGPDCRSEVYKVLQQVYSKEYPQNSPQDQVQKLKQLSVAGLLAGLSDPDEALQNASMAFWSSATVDLPTGAADRLLCIIRKVFVDESADLFLTSCLELMLQGTTLSPDFSKLMFPRTLVPCTYQKQNLQVSWRTQHSTVTPYFAETLASQITSRLDSSSSSFNQPLLQATRTSWGFEPTETDGINNSEEIAVGSTFTFGRTVNANFVEDSSREAGSSRGWRPGYRILSDPKASSIFFARREVYLSTRRSQVLKDQKAKVQANVRVLREYRIGDFPDVQIPFSAIIQPLQALAKRDLVIARQLFVSLFCGVNSELKKSGDGSDTFLSAMEAELQQKSQAAEGAPAFVGAVIEIALKCNIELKLDLIRKACTNNGLAPVGCLLLEKYLLFEEPEPSPVKRQRFNQPDLDSMENQQWLTMAELYLTLGESDEVLAVLHKSLQDNKDLCSAVRYEASLQWQKAKEKYENFLNGGASKESKTLKDFTTNAYCKCLEKLSDWTQLDQYVTEELCQNKYDIVWTESNQENLLPWLLKSEIHNIFETSGNDTNFLEVFSQWQKDATKMSFLQSRFSEDLAILSVVGEDWVKAQLYSRLVLRSFLEDWSVLSRLQPCLRAQKLEKLHSISEIIRYAEARNTEDEKQLVTNVMKVCKSWESSLPHAADSLVLWEKRIKYRNYFAAHALASIQRAELGEANESRLKQVQRLQKLSLVELGVQQKNISVAKKFISHAKMPQHEEGLQGRFEVAASRIKWLTATHCSKIEDKGSRMLKAIHELDAALGTIMNAGEKMHIEKELSVMAWQVREVLLQQPDLAYSPAVVTQLGNLNMQSDTAAVELEEFGYRQARSAMRSAGEQLRHNSNRSTRLDAADAAMCVVRHLRPLVQSEESSVLSDELTKQFVQCLLAAMRFGSSEARTLFPCLLQMKTLVTKHLKLFKKEILCVPEWMFLGWINQLLAFAGTEMEPVVATVLLRIADKYPKALTLPFQFTAQRLRSQQVNSSLVDRLKGKVAPDKVTELMLKALSYVTQPDLVLRDHLQKLSLLLKSDIDKDTFDEACRAMMDDVFPKEGTNQLHGSVWENFDKYKSEAAKLSSNIDINTIKATISQLQQKLKAKTTKRENVLECYSPWLSNFQASNFSCEIELPGQYTGDCAPCPQNHVTFNSFAPCVTVLNSLRLPTKLRVIGNNGRTYNFLVKSGEDLRQDERLQQLFRLMNEIMAHDPACKSRKLHINTYQVVPLSSQLGLIEFVPDCKTLSEFLSTNQTKEDKKKLEHVSSAYQKWIRSSGGNAREAGVMFDNFYINVSSKTAVEMFEKLLSEAPFDLLRRAFNGLQVSPEGLFWMRRNFASSAGVMNVAHWLLGVGDRHANNMMVSQQSGAAVGIDFGHAFGSACQLLPVPELMPFRLTQTMETLMGPLRHAGVMQASMVHCLRALRASSDLLLSTMKVFVQEPALNWQENAERLADNFARAEVHDSGEEGSDNMDTSEDNQGQVENYAIQKLKLAQRKLEGALPAVVMEEELCHGKKSSSRALPHMLSVVRGQEASVRRKLYDEAVRTVPLQETDAATRQQILALNFSPEQQVDCLIDQATDPNVLGHTWPGWQPWL